MSDLQNDLKDIDGVGEKTAEKILSVLQEDKPEGYTTGLDNDTTDAERHPLLQKAIDRANEDNQREAAMYLRRYDSAE